VVIYHDLRVAKEGSITERRGGFEISAFRALTSRIQRRGPGCECVGATFSVKAFALQEGALGGC